MLANRGYYFVETQNSPLWEILTCVPRKLRVTQPGFTFVQFSSGKSKHGRDFTPNRLSALHNYEISLFTCKY